MCMKMKTVITFYVYSFVLMLLFFHLKGTVGDLLKSKDDETTTWKCVESNALSSMGLTTSVRKVVRCT